MEDGIAREIIRLLVAFPRLGSLRFTARGGASMLVLPAGRLLGDVGSLHPCMAYHMYISRYSTFE